MPQGDFEQFGIPAENIEAAQKWATKQRKKYRYHTRVPTRKEVRNMPPPQLIELLVGWMVHSPVEIIPSRVQIALVAELLRARSDAAAFGDVLKMCKNYVEGQ
jgi:hypothetical protein